MISKFEILEQVICVLFESKILMIVDSGECKIANQNFRRIQTFVESNDRDFRIIENFGESKLSMIKNFGDLKIRIKINPKLTKNEKFSFIKFSHCI